MSVELIYDTAPLGALVAWTNGEPRPPERFRAKLRAWERANAGGRLVRRCPARREGGFVAPASITLDLGATDPSVAILSGRRLTLGVTSPLRFRIVAPPPLGWVRILSGEGEDAELLHLARDRPTAETWRQATGRAGAVLQDIDADELAAAAVEGRFAA